MGPILQLQCASFSLQWLLLLRSLGSRVRSKPFFNLVKCNTYPEAFLMQKDKAKINTYKANTHVTIARLRNRALGEFLGCPVVMTRCLHFQGWVQSLVGELRSHKLWGMAKTNTKNKKEKKQSIGIHCLCCILVTALWHIWYSLFSGGPDSEESACNAGDLGSVPRWGRSPGGGHGNPLQYSCLENPIDRGAWRAAVCGVTKSWTRLSD